MDKLEYYKKQYPDARQYLEKTQSYIKEAEARNAVYAKEVEAKVLFYRDVPSTTGVTQQYIFSERAAKSDKRLKESLSVHEEQLNEPYH